MRYPDFCFSIAEKMDKDPNLVMSFPCRTMAEAQNFQLTFNCFKRAALDKGWSDPQIKQRFFFATLGNVTVRVKPQHNGTAVCEVRNINTDEIVARWNKQAELDEGEQAIELAEFTAKHNGTNYPNS